MFITERGRIVYNNIDERGRLASVITSNGHIVFPISIIGEHPIVSILSVSNYTISDELGANQSIIIITFDKDVTQYVAMLNGVDHTTGTLIHSGGALTAGIQGQVIIDWNELTTEGQNRINIYGQGADGSWTKYES